MIASKSKRPKYVGIDWSAIPQGYTFLRPSPISPSIEVKQKTSDEWMILLSIFNDAKNGCFDSLNLLPTIIRNSTDFHIICASLRIMGDAGTELSVAALAEFYTHPDPDVRLAAYSATVNSANLDLIKELIKSASQLERGMELDILADSVSESLEWEQVQLLEPKNPVEFQSITLDIISDIETRVGKGNPIMFGEILSIQNIITQIRNFIIRSDSDENDDIIADYLLRFEAMTGIWVREWFDEDENVDYALVQQSLDEYETNGKGSFFEVGQRYFFGHPIPSG